MYSFKCYLSKLEHVAHYKAKNQNTVKQTCASVRGCMHACTHAHRVSASTTHMDPSQCDKVILVLVKYQLLFMLHVAAIWGTRLAWNEQVCDLERVPRLQRKKEESHSLINKWNHYSWKNKPWCSPGCFFGWGVGGKGSEGCNQGEKIAWNTVMLWL